MKTVLIIGGGPGGLTTLKTLLHFPNREFDPVVLEAAPRVGGTFSQRSYENGNLVSSKQLTCFSDYRFPLDSPDHVPMNTYVEYLERYVVRFGLDSNSGDGWNGTALEGQSRLQLNTRVVGVEKLGKGRHRIRFVRAGGAVEQVEVDAVAFATGLHVTPAIPVIPGLSSNLVPQSDPVATLAGTPTIPTPEASSETWNVKDGVRVIHSSQYKKREEFKDRRVMILGIGETSMDLSYEAIQAGAREVVVCHRGGFLSFPKVLNDFKVFGVSFDGDLPIDGLITNLFETAYVHPWVAASHIRWFVSDFVIKRVLWFLTGTQAGCNQWVGALPPARAGRAYVFLNKSTKAMPYINLPYKPSSRFLSDYLHTEYIDPPSTAVPSRAQSIDLALWPAEVLSTGQVKFSPSASLPQSGGIHRVEEDRMGDAGGRVFKPDMVVFATGYRTDWGWVGPEYRPGAEARVRDICDRDDVSAAWVGFVRPGVGAIPPIAEQQAMLWALLLLERVPIPTSKPHYKLLASSSARIQHGVDYSAYMATLAGDMGAAPSLRQLWSEYGFKVLVAYCFGAAFVPYYRLVGPFRSPEMEEIVTTELWETITRRGVLGNLFMGLIPMIFYGLVNGLALLVESILTVLVVPVARQVGLDGVLPALVTGNAVHSSMQKKMD